jgi:phosphonate transport system permease protein
MTAAEALVLIEIRRRSRGSRRIKIWAAVVLVAAFYVASWRFAQVDPVRLVSGLPRLAQWLAEAWPPQVSDLPLILQRTAETIAMAALRTTMATLLAVPTAMLASRNITPVPLLYVPVRWFLNALRGIDSFVFAVGRSNASAGLACWIRPDSEPTHCRAASSSGWRSPAPLRNDQA